jgi:3-hydroxyisobutyrate dehydrogenase-like beta-hydroxyacid dehydrogenase
MNVGFVGLGDQGLPMAQMILASGYPLTVWARRAASVESFAGTDAVVAETLVELGCRSDLVGVCVGGDDDVREVVLGDAGLAAEMAPGSIVLIHSTVAPETVVDVAAALAPRGIAVLDAPVSGSGHGARNKTLTVMVGGDAEVFQRAQSVFATYGEGFLLGPLGAGQQMKLLNNAIFIANLQAVYAGVEVARRLGMDGDAVEAILSRSSARSYSITSMQNFRKLDSLAGRRAVLEKDLRHFEELVEGRADASTFSDAGRRLFAWFEHLDDDRRHPGA